MKSIIVLAICVLSCRAAVTKLPDSEHNGMTINNKNASIPDITVVPTAATSTDQPMTSNQSKIGDLPSPSTEPQQKPRDIPVEPTVAPSSSSTENPPTTKIPTTTAKTTTTITTLKPTTKTTAPSPTTSSTTPSPTTSSTTPKPIPTSTTPTTSTTQNPKPSSSTTEPNSSTTPAPTPSNRGFDGPSFIGGIVLAAGSIAIGFVAFKFYRARTELNYHTL